LLKKKLAKTKNKHKKDFILISSTKFGFGLSASKSVRHKTAARVAAVIPVQTLVSRQSLSTLGFIPLPFGLSQPKPGGAP